MLTDKLNSLVTTGVIAAAVAYSMQAEMPSGRLAFVTSSDVRRNRTSFSVQRSCSGHEFGSTSIDWTSTGWLRVVETFNKVINH